MDDAPRDLETAVDELTETLLELQAELRDPPRGPLGLPRPPTPAEVLRFTEEYTLPAIVSILEASIRVLELVRASIRLLEGRTREAERTAAGAVGAGSTGRSGPSADRLASVGLETMEALDDALADLQRAAADGDPASPQLQRLLSDARELNAEVERRLERARTVDDRETHSIEIRDGSGGTGGSGGADRGTASGEAAGTGADVESELESIKEDLEGRDQPGEAHGETDDPLEDDERFVDDE